MINGLCRGDRVKLTDRYATVLMNRDRGPKLKSLDWLKRRGVVDRLNQNDVYVLWDGRKSYDTLPHKAVEKVRPLENEVNRVSNLASSITG